MSSEVADGQPNIAYPGVILNSVLDCLIFSFSFFFVFNNSHPTLILIISRGVLPMNYGARQGGSRPRRYKDRCGSGAMV